MDQDNRYLKDLRIKCGYTQQEVADRIGVSKATISKYEKGLRGINHIEELSKLYNVEPIYILTGITSEQWRRQMEDEIENGEEAERSYWESVLLPNQVSRMKQLLDNLNDEGQQKAIERVEELTEIPRYRAETASQPSPAPPEDTDTTPPPGGAEKPSGGPETPKEGE